MKPVTPENALLSDAFLLRSEGGKVTVDVGGKHIVHAYIARLSFASFGREGAAP